MRHMVFRGCSLASSERRGRSVHRGNRPQRRDVLLSVKRWLLTLTACLTLVAAVSCDFSGAAPTPTAQGTPVPATPSGTAETRPRPAEEQAVVTALANAGIRLSYLGVSKFDWVLGDAVRRSGGYTGTVEGTQVRADVLYLDAPVNDVTVCTESESGQTKFTVRVRGRVLGTSPFTGSSAFGVALYFAMSDRLFVMTSDVRVRDALMRGLGLTEPRC